MLTVSTHSRPKAADCGISVLSNHAAPVSTHSRPKAAEVCSNLQPFRVMAFQHTAARRRLTVCDVPRKIVALVSTHSRPKAAENQAPNALSALIVSTHSRPKAAEQRLAKLLKPMMFQHTAARRRLNRHQRHHIHIRSFNTQPPEGG